MKKIFVVLFSLVIVAVVAGVAFFKTRGSAFDTNNPLMASTGPIALLNDLNTEELPRGWAHRKFLTVSPTHYELIENDGAKVLSCKTDNTASILARDTSIALSTHPILSWRWKVVQPIDSDVDEGTEAGDDHPARFFISFANEEGIKKSMEIIWSNKKYVPGDYKIIGAFYHYVANGLVENIGQWHEQSVDLRDIYEQIGGTGTPTLDTLGFFCDSDNTGGSSESLFKDILLSAGN